MLKMLFLTDSFTLKLPNNNKNQQQNLANSEVSTSFLSLNYSS